MIGGHAVNHYGVIRATQDIDFIVNLVIENGVEVDGELKALCQEFGADALYTDLRTRIEELRHA